MTEEIKFEEVENGCKVSVPLFTNLELEKLDYNIQTHYEEIIKQISETVSRDKDIIVLKRVIQKQDTEINKLKEIISKAIGHIEACKTTLGNYILSSNETEYLLNILSEERKGKYE